MYAKGASKVKAAVQPRLCIAGGAMFFGLGFAGMFLPLLPTTIFWILAAWLFAKSHPQMQQRIYDWPKVGPVVEDFVENGAIRPAAKNAASMGIVGIGGLSLWLSGLSGAWLLGVIGVLAAVILFIQTRPTPSSN